MPPFEALQKRIFFYMSNLLFPYLQSFYKGFSSCHIKNNGLLVVLESSAIPAILSPPPPSRSLLNPSSVQSSFDVLTDVHFKIYLSPRWQFTWNPAKTIPFSELL